MYGILLLHIFDSCSLNIRSTLATTHIFQPQSNPLTTLISRKRDKIRQKSFSFEKSGEFGHTRKFYRHKFKRTLQLSFATDLIEQRTSGTLIIVKKNICILYFEEKKYLNIWQIHFVFWKIHIAIWKNQVYKFKRTAQQSFATDLIEKRTSGTLIIVK